MAHLEERPQLEDFEPELGLALPKRPVQKEKHPASTGAGTGSLSGARPSYRAFKMRPFLPGEPHLGVCKVPACQVGL